MYCIMCCNEYVAMLHRPLFSLVVFRGDLYIALHSAQSDESIYNIKLLLVYSFKWLSKFIHCIEISTFDLRLLTAEYLKKSI
jgi:hypothetical protein